jgi:hypothetical protein
LAAEEELEIAMSQGAKHLRNSAGIFELWFCVVSFLVRGRHLSQLYDAAQFCRFRL